MRYAWIAGCLLLLAACSNKVTDSAVALTVKYQGYTPLCVRVSASDAAAPERRSDELITQSKLASDEDRTLILAVYREKSWGSRLRIEVASYATADCTGGAIETRELASAVTLPDKGSVTAALELLAQDADEDGYVARAPGDSAIQGTDCDDGRSAVHPGATAVCDGAANLATDFDCDGKLDCNGGGCTSDAMCGSGFCVAGICCDSACDEPSQCRSAGTCGTGTCVYPVDTGAACDDGNACTSDDRCGASGTCTGTVCSEPPGQCFEGTGTCNPSSGACSYAPRPSSASCDDGKACTASDMCDGVGGCSGTLYCPPPSVCKEAMEVCTADNQCQFRVAIGQVGKVCYENRNAGTCQADGTCQPLRFNYAVTDNFAPEAIASNPIDDLVIPCGATFDSSGTPSWVFDTGCGVTPPRHEMTPEGYVVIPVRHLTVDAPLRVVGERPVILAVYGDATLNHELLAHSEREDSPRVGAGSGVGCVGRTGGSGGVANNDGSGGGGGGLATAGGLGGANDNGSAAGGTRGGALMGGFSPLVGGCSGGEGGGIAGDTTPGAGGKGGGALQLSVAGTLNLKSVVSVSGAGGKEGISIDNKAAGGGGGGSGGLLVLEADILVVDATARVTANGGAGGGGSGYKGGSRFPGNPGANGSTRSDTPAAGGSGGMNGGSTVGGAGGLGAAGSTGPGDGVAGDDPGGTDGAGGGGGGAAGRILLRGVTSCSPILAGAIISPAATGNCSP